MLVVKGQIYFPAGAGSGGGGDTGAPAIIAPYPGIGNEGDFYSAQIRTTGATPQTFELTAGELPIGTTLGADTGLITGTIDYPDGGLYTGTITVTNAEGSTTYDFTILINGTAPSFGWDWPVAAVDPPYFLSGVFVQDNAFINFDGGASLSQSPTSVAGSNNIAWTFTNKPTRLNGNASTGELSPVFTQADISCIYPFSVTGTNYFGAATTANRIWVFGDVIWGEWSGALPGSFTASDITNTLTDDFGEVPSGPRRTSLFGYTWTVVSCPRLRPTFRFPVLGGAKVRVLAIPQGWLTGNSNTIVDPDTFVPPTFDPVQAPWAMNWNAYNGGGPSDSTFSPAWPTPYQTGLNIGGILYDIYVTSAITDSPVGTSVGGYFYLSPEGTPI